MNLRIIIKEEIDNSYRNSNNILETEYYLDKVINKLLLINEVEWKKDEPSPTYQWDITPEVEDDLDSSKEWVKTKDDVIEYLNLLLKKLKNIPKPLKIKIVKYVLASFLGILTMAQVKTLEKQVEKTDTIKKVELNTKTDKVEKKKQYERIRKPSQNLFDHLKFEEGYKRTDEKTGEVISEPALKAYKLGDGAKTIGYGHAVFADPSRGDNGGNYDFLPKYEKITSKTRITPEQAEILLKDDINIASQGLNDILDSWEEQGIKPEITQNMYDAMVSMIYNMGIGNFRKSEFIQLVKKGEIENAAEQIKQESNHLFSTWPGLKNRRQAEFKMFISNRA